MRLSGGGGGGGGGGEVLWGHAGNRPYSQRIIKAATYPVESTLNTG